MMRTLLPAATSLLALLFASTAAAQDDWSPPPTSEAPTPEQAPIFVEGTFGYGFQFGETSYLPDGMPGQYMHPLVNGYTVGGTAGYFFTPGVAVVLNYEYASASSSEGSLDGVIDSIEGEIDYHTLVVGLRLWEPVGFGALRAEFGLGVVLPYQTELEVQYGPGLMPAGITGSGTQTESYSLGVGGHALLGYEVPITGPLYAALNLKIKAFQSTNDGETTEYENFVTDFGAMPPTAVDAEIEHGDGAAQPTTNSVQEARLQLAVGVRF